MSRTFDDEDPTPRAVPAKKPPVPAKPAGKPSAATKAGPAIEDNEPKQLRLHWGHVGSLTTPGRLSDGTSRPGVIRVVEANIHYDVPPLDPYVWSPAGPNLVNQYEMFWTEGNPAEVRSLTDLGAELRGGNPPKPRLAVLDNVADTLLDTTQRLHARDCRLGLLHPANVLIAPGSDGRRVVLPDLGFTWTGSHGNFPWKDSPGRPKWLAEDPRENPNVRLWDEEPVWQQFSSSGETNGYQQLVPVEADLKTLARTFSAVLTGRIDREVPVPNAAPVWGVLRAVMKGDITSAEDFRARLAEHPLSEHWLAPKAKTPKKKGSLLPLVACLGLLLLGGLGALAALYFGGFLDSNRSTESSQLVSNLTPSSRASTPTSSKQSAHPLEQIEVDWKNRPATLPPPSVGFDDLLKQFDAANDPKVQRDLLERMYEKYLTSDGPTRDQLRPWIEHFRSKYVDGWEQRYHEADDAVVKDIGLRFESGQRIYNLHQELLGLREHYESISPSLNEREVQCLEISDLRSRELGSQR
jgi:hypothetical protein